MKKNVAFLLLFLFLVSLNANETKHILLLNSYHQGMTWVDNLTKGVNDVLEIEKNNYILHIENMDTKRHHSEEYYESLANLYKNKYSNIKLDLVLSSDNNAFDFLRKYRNDIFGNVPVSFSGVNYFKDSMLQGHTNYTGVEENFSASETVDMILKIHPEVKNIYIVNDYLKTGRAWENTMKEQLEKFKDKVNITYAPNQTLKELQHTIKTLSDDTILLMGVYFADKDKNYLTYEKVGKYLLDISPVPVYCLLKFNISDGVVGGKVISGYYQGAMMAKLGKKILQGTSADNITIVKEGANRFIFNKKGMTKFRVDEYKIPETSEIINDEITLFQQYKVLVNFLLVFFIVSIFVIYFMYKKKDQIDEKNILRILVYGPIIFIPTIIAVLIYSILSNSKLTYEKDIKELKSEHIQRQKDITRIEIQRIVDYVYIEIKRNKEKLEKLVDETPAEKERLRKELQELSKKRILNYISNFRYSKFGYMFVLDEKGILLAHGAYPDMVGQNMYNMKDENGFFYTREIIKKAKNNSMKFTKYLWKNPKTNEVSTKYTYSEYIPECEIIVSSGVYSDDINEIVNRKTLDLKDKNDTQLKEILVIAFIVLIVGVLLSFALSSIIKKIFKRYNKELDLKNESLKKLNESLEFRVQEEVLNNQQKDKMLNHQAKMASMGEMLENIAHQWRQPLNTISVAASGIEVQKENNMLSDEHLDYYTNAILENTNYLSQTIDDFRDFFKKDKKEQQFDLGVAIEHSLNVINTSLKKYSIEVEKNYDETISLNTYKSELIQVLMNILNNAKDALESSNNESRVIIISSVDLGDKIEISIQDNGNGIKDEIIEKIFEAYFTTKHQSKGTGLGMHMAYNIVVQHLKGEIKAENVNFEYKGENYKGARFSIILNKTIEA